MMRSTNEFIVYLLPSVFANIILFSKFSLHDDRCGWHQYGCLPHAPALHENSSSHAVKNENFCKCYKKNEVGKFETTKKDKKSHGYGIKIIEKTVEKYNGDLNIKIDNGIFRIIILLPQKEKLVIDEKQA